MKYALQSSQISFISFGSWWRDKQSWGSYSLPTLPPKSGCVAFLGGFCGPSVYKQNTNSYFPHKNECDNQVTQSKYFEKTINAFHNEGLNIIPFPKVLANSNGHLFTRPKHRSRNSLSYLYGDLMKCFRETPQSHYHVQKVWDLCICLFMRPCSPVLSLCSYYYLRGSSPH